MQPPPRRDELYATTAARYGDFEFDEDVADVFDDMVVRSVPFYIEQQLMIREIAARYWAPGTTVYDLGCSTGTTLIGIGRRIAPSASLVGIDNSTPMLERARRKLADAGLGDRTTLIEGDLNGDLDALNLQNAGVVTACWVLQFVRPARRDRLIRWIYDGLVPGGVLVVTEKILTANSVTNRFFIDVYLDFKRRNGYSETEIAKKREALENILVPYRMQENLELFRRNGFEVVDTFFQWYNFAGYVCVKTPDAEHARGYGRGG